MHLKSMKIDAQYKGMTFVFMFLVKFYLKFNARVRKNKQITKKKNTVLQRGNMQM